MSDLDTCSRCGQPREIYAKRRKLCKPCYPLDLAERKAQIDPEMDKAITHLSDAIAPRKAVARTAPVQSKRDKVPCGAKPVTIKGEKSHKYAHGECTCGRFEIAVPVGKVKVDDATAQAQAALDFHLH